MNTNQKFLDIYLIRHAKSEGSKNNWISSMTPLSEVGRSQARNLAKYLRNSKIEAVFLSPLKRAKCTAEIIRESIDNVLIYETLEWLAEINFGDYDGLNKKMASIPNTIQNKPSFLVNRLLNSTKEFNFPNGESLNEFWHRVSKGFEDLLVYALKLNLKTLALIGHGGSFTVIILKLLNFKYEDYNFPLFYINQANYLKVRIRDNKTIFLELNPI